MMDRWYNWEEVLRLAEGRSIVPFGRGEWLDKLLNYIPLERIPFVLDNNPNEDNTIEHGLKVMQPDFSATCKDGVLVIITTSSFPAVKKQLLDNGFVEGVNFCISPSLQSYSVICDVVHHEADLLFTCSDLNGNGGLYSMALPTGNIKRYIGGSCHGLCKIDNDMDAVINDDVGIQIIDWLRGCDESRTISLPKKSRPHGLAYNKDKGLFYVAFSGRDSIGIYDTNGAYVNEIGMTTVASNNEGSPQRHINDLCYYNGVLYVSMFSLSGNWKRGVYDGGVRAYDVESRSFIGYTDIIRDLWLPHSPEMINGELHYCDSMRGVVYKGSRVLFEFNGFIRGLDHDGKYYYIGQSQHRYIDRRIGTSNNISLDTGIFIADAKTKATKFYSLSGLVDINNLMVISV